MNHTALISATALRDALAAPDAARRLVVLDASFDLADTGAGERTHATAHVPQAQYVHLDRDLSGPKTGRTGRHPLPEREAFARTVGRLGVAPGVQVVALDAQGGAFAARVWWMLKWLGHADVAVLDGGIAAWLAAGGELIAAAPVVEPQAPYPAHASLVPQVDADTLLAELTAGSAQVVDARAAERFRGDVEPLDPVAGHIPGALNRFFKDNLESDGRFKDAARLRAEFTALLGDATGSRIVHQCGSGATACHNLLAMEVAGLGGTRLYPGSWSEWCADPARPVARG